MRISRVELDRLIEGEINEIFGFGKEAPKDYPADGIVIIMRALENASRLAGAELTPDQREAIVDEFIAALKSRGFVIKEQGRLEIGEQDILITHENAPKLKVFLDSIAQTNPKIFKQLLGFFNRSAFDISAVVKNIIPSITQVGTREPDSRESEDDEDLTDTEVDLPPVSVPEEEADEPGEEEPEEEEDLSDELKVGDIVRVKENDISGIKPGDYEVADIYAGTRNDPQPRVLLTAEDGEGGHIDHLSLIVNNPEYFQINPEEEELEPEEEKPAEITPEDIEAGDETLKQKMFGMFSFDKDNLDNIDLLLTAGGIIPGGLGCIMGAVNAVFNFSRGEWLWGAFDTVFAVPPICGSGAGEAASAGKGIFKALGKVAAKLGGKSPKVLAKAAEQAAKAGKTLGKAEKAALKEFDKVVKTTEKGLAKVIGKEAAAKHTGKYVTKLLGAIKGKKTKEQVNAVVALLPDSFFENMDEVLNKPVKDIWGTEIIAKMDKLLEKVGIDLVGEKYEKLLDGAQVDMILFLANKAGILSDENYPEMKKTIAEIRESANADKNLTKEQRIEKFIADVSDDEEDAAAPSPRPRFGQSGKKMRPTPGVGPPIAEELLREQKELDRMKVLAGIK